ncbi:hypothetical protein F4806DRAFT_503245 [Annulohypoxylon nitens]|nr:hypothetical protein F4806DRAFT_503245 [Annulohypoxylon nitens]
MSGLEIVGIVLGTIPIAIQALKECKKFSKRFYTIRAEFTKCDQTLKCHQTFFEDTMRKLLQPLIKDEDRMKLLLSDPGGNRWADKEIARFLQEALGERRYEDFINCVQQLSGVMIKLAQLLELSPIPKDHSKQPDLPSFESRSDVPRRISKRLRFILHETTRNNLFRELDMLDRRLRQITSDKTLPMQSPIDSQPYSTTLCSIWKHASALFKALSTSWACCCQGRHLAELLLQHRDTDKNEFNMLFAKHLASCWQIQRALITADDDPHSTKLPINSYGDITVATHRPPDHRTRAPLRSALKKVKAINIQEKSTGKEPSVSCTSIPTHSPMSKERIISLCGSLNEDDNACYGYVAEEDYKYYVCRLSRRQAERFDSVTLDQIIKQHQGLKKVSRLKRYKLSFTLASAFLQLLDTAWLPNKWKKSDIVFFKDEENHSCLRLDQPYLKREFITSAGSNDGQQDQIAGTTTIYSASPGTPRSLELFGIVLLELCFGEPLEKQEIRKELPDGNDELLKYIYDVSAARQWNEEVLEEAGMDFEEAIKWCLQEYRYVSSERWRQEMMHHVVQPLGRCAEWLSKR